MQKVFHASVATTKDIAFRPRIYLHLTIYIQVHHFQYGSRF